MAQLRLSSAAQGDFDEIVDYLTEVAGRRTAASYADRLRESINLTPEFPGLGSPRPHLGPETRVTIVARI